MPDVPVLMLASVRELDAHALTAHWGSASPRPLHCTCSACATGWLCNSIPFVIYPNELRKMIRRNQIQVHPNRNFGLNNILTKLIWLDSLQWNLLVSV
jgi:hypothetical protein